MKNFLIILAFFPLSLFSQQSVLSSFNGYGDIVNVIDVDPTDSLFTIEINNFYGSPRFQPFGPWIAQDVQVGMVMWVDCARFVITNVNSASFSTMNIDVKVPSVDWNLGVATPLPNSRCAVVFEDQYLLTALPAPADGNSGALSGINNTLFACMLNHYSQALLVTKNSVNEITDYVAGLDTIPSEAPGPNIGETWRNSVGQLFYSDGTQWLTDKEIKFSNASLEGLPSYLYKLGIDTLGQDTLYISNNGIFRRFQSGLVYKEGYGINIFATDSIEVDTNQIATQNDLTPLLSGNGVTNYLAQFTGLKTLDTTGVIWVGGRLGIGTATPTRQLTTTQDIQVNGRRIGLGTGNTTTNTFLVAGVGPNFTGNNTVAVGSMELLNLTTAVDNTLVGALAGNNLTSGGSNTYIGRSAGGSNLTETGNFAMGAFSLLNHNAGNFNIAIGFDAGRRISTDANMTNSENSIFIGRNTRPLANGNLNQIIIGHLGTGLGTNTTVIGNSSTTQTWLGGSLTLGTQSAPAARLHVVGADALASGWTAQFHNSSTNNALMIRNDGNIGIGNNSPTARLRVTGVDAANNTFALNVENGSSNSLFSIVNNGYIRIGNLGSLAPRLYSGSVATGGDVDLSGELFTINQRSTNTLTGSLGAVTVNGPSFNGTSGNQTVLGLFKGFNPTSGNTVYTMLGLNSVINQTGTANGTVIGLDYNPILTSVLGTHYAALFRSGSVGIGTATPAQTLHVAGTMRLTGNAGTATEVLGRDASGDISGVPFSTIVSSGGGLTGNGVVNYLSQYNSTSTLDTTGIIWVGGRMGIGTASPNSRVTIQGQTDNSTTTSINVLNNSGSSYFQARNDGFVLFNNARTISGAMSLQSSGGSNTIGISLGIINPFTATSGDTYLISNATAYEPSSGNGTYTFMSIRPTINQTGGANGATRGIVVQPTLTSAPNWRSIEWTNSGGFGLYGIGTAPNYINGNLLLGNLINNARLRVQGPAATASTFGLIVTNSDTTTANATLVVRDDKRVGIGTTSLNGLLTIAGAAATPRLYIEAPTNTEDANIIFDAKRPNGGNIFTFTDQGRFSIGNGLGFYPTTGGSAAPIVRAGGGVFVGEAAASTNTSLGAYVVLGKPNNFARTTTGVGNTATSVELIGTYSPASTNIRYNMLSIIPVYNQTGTANGAFTGIDYNPTITNLVGPHYAATFRTGFVGIGTADPTDQLHTTGSVRLQNYPNTLNSTGNPVNVLSTSSTGVVESHSISEVISSAGGITGSGVNGQVSFWTGTSTQSGDNGLFWDNTNKRLGVGITTPQSNIHVASTGAGGIFQRSSNDISSPVIFFRKTRGTIASPLAVQSGDLLGTFGFEGLLSNNTTFSTDFSFFGGQAAAAPTATTLPINIFFKVGSTASPYNASFYIHHSGRSRFGTNNMLSVLPQPNAKLEVVGEGETSGTTAFLVRNGAATPANLLSVLDNGNVGVGTAAPAVALDVFGRSIIGSSFAIPNVSSQYFILSSNDASRSISNNTGSNNANYTGYGKFFVDYSGADAFTSGTGLLMGANNRNTNANNNITGGFFIVTNDVAAAKAGTLTALRSYLANSSTTSLNNAIGLDLDMGFNDAASVITNYYGARVRITTNSGVMTNTYGFFVDDITKGTQTNTPFSFYASDPNALNYFAGNTGIGVTAPSRTLDINGETRIRDLTTTTATGLVGADADGVLSNVTFASAVSQGGGVSGTGVAGQVAYWSGTQTQTGSSSLVYNDTQKSLTLSNSTQSGVPRGWIMQQTTGDGASNSFIMQKSRAGVITSGTDIGTWDSEGFDGAAYQKAARIAFTATGTIGSGIVPGTISFLTANSSGTLTARTTVNHLGELNHFGNVGIGALGSPAASLHVKGSGNTTGTWTAQFHNSAGNNNALMIRDDGRVSFGTASPSKPFHVSGEAYFASALQLEAGLQDNRGNVFLSQSLNTVTSNRDLVIGNATYKRIRLHSKEVYISASFPASESLFYVDGGTGSGALDRQGIYMRPTQPAVGGNVNGGDVIIELPNGTGTGRKGTVLIGSATATGPSAILELNSTDRGFLPPRMTTTQRDAIASPAAGLTIYNTTVGVMQHYNGSTWTDERDNTNGLSGLGVTNYLAQYNSSNTLDTTGIIWTGGRMGIGTATPSSTFDVVGTVDFQNPTTAFDEGQLGNNLLTTGSGTNWTGSNYSTGYTHVVGSTAALTSAFTPLSSQDYRIDITLTNRTAGTYTVSFGGFTSSSFSTSASFIVRTSSTAAFVVNPQSVFDGTISATIRLISNSNPILTARSSSGSIVYEQRISNTDNIFFGLLAGSRNFGTNNIFIGGEAGLFNTSGTDHTFIGKQAGRANQTGIRNTFIGATAGTSNTTGEQNTFIGRNSGTSNTTGGFSAFLGASSGQSNTTGNFNTFIGQSAGLNNTSGSNSVLIGYQSGRYIGTGTTNATIINSSILIGQDSRSLGDNETNQIVIADLGRGLGSNTTRIGNTSTIQTHLDGRLTIGNTFYDSRVAARIVGADASTSNYSLVVTDSDGATSTTVDPNFVVRNDGNVGIGTYSPTAKLEISPSANQSAFVLSNYSLTGSNNQSAINIEGTWNTTGNPTFIRANLTNTASNANSILFQLAVNNTNAFAFRTRGVFELGAGCEIFTANSTGGTVFGGTNLGFYNLTPTNSNLYGSFAFVGSNITGTTGTFNQLHINRTFAPTSGTSLYKVMHLTSTINQTGGANGITRGIHIDPTLTSAADWRSIEWTNNSGYGLYGAGTANNYLAGSLGIGSTTPARLLHVQGEARISDLTTDTPTRIVGADADGDLGEITLGSGLSITSGVLNTSSTLNTGSGTAGQVTFWNGTNSITGSNNLFWDSGNSRLGIGTTTPASSLQINGSATVATGIQFNNAGSLGYIFGDGVSMNIRSGATEGLQINSASAIITAFNGSTGKFAINLGVLTTAPLYSFFADGNTGIGRNAEDVLTFYAGGERARFSSGDFGINTTAPAARLHVVGAGTTSGYGLIVTDVNNTTATASLVVQDNGRVGIGTNAPLYKLDVRGTVSTSDNTLPTFLVNNTLAEVFDQQEVGQLQFKISDSSIGASTPTGNIAMIINDNTAGGPVQGAAGEGADMVFRTGLVAVTSQNQVITERMRITKTGNVGIGTTTPTSLFDVIGNVEFQNPTTSYDGGTFGTELLTTGSGTGWTGSDYTTGYTHSDTNFTNVLTSVFTPANGTIYRVVVTCSGRTVGTATVTFGGKTVTTFTSNTTVTLDDITTSTAALVVTPSKTFNGTITASVKIISVSSAQFIGKNSSGTTVYEERLSSTNIFQGVNVGRYNTTGSNNIYQGQNSGRSNTSGFGNVFQGASAGYSNTTGYYNVFQGPSAGYSNTTGFSNIFQGPGAGFSNTTGASNIFQGVDAGRDNTTGNNNIFQGVRAGRLNTTGPGNVFQGLEAGSSNTTGAYNIFVGGYAGFLNTTANYNFFVGLNAGYSNTTGGNNIFQGYNAAYSNTTGNNNVVIGNLAGRYIVGSSTNNTLINNSILIGYDSRTLSSGETNQIVIGYEGRGLGNNTTRIGNTSTLQTHLDGRLTVGNTLYDANTTARIVGLNNTASTYALVVTNSTAGTNTTSAPALVVTNTQNVGIGLAAPDNRLEIRGTTANNTASSFRVRNSTPTTLFEVRNDGVVFLGPWTLWYPFNNATGVATPVPDGKLMRLSWGASGATENGYGIFASNAQITNRDYTSGDGGSVRLGEGYAPTSGTGEYNFLYMSGTINQTGGANGTTRGIFLAPTLTSAANYRAIQWNNSTGFGLYGEGTAPNRLNGILSLPSTSEASPGLQFNSNSAVGLYSSDVNNIGLVSGDRKQLLLEKAATNLLVQSENIATTWIQLGGGSGTTITTNVATAPNGTMTADKIVCNFNLGYGIRQTLTGTFLAGRTYTFSVWARTDSTNILSLDINDATASIKKMALTNNWIRYSTTFTFTSNTTNPFVDITFDATLQNALNKHMYVWGMQFEESLNPTMYIPTTTVSASKLSGFYFVDSTTVEMSIIDRKVGINNTNPAKSLHVTGEVRISDLDNGVATRIVGATADGDLDELTLGSGLSITSGTISVTNPISASEVFIESSTATTIDLDANTGVVKDVNGTNASFTLPTDLSRLNVYKNGIRLARTGTATTRDFSVNTGTNEITFTTALLSTDRIVIVKI